jgi:hypothetical protein
MAAIAGIGRKMRVFTSVFTIIRLATAATARSLERSGMSESTAEAFKNVDGGKPRGRPASELHRCAVRRSDKFV